MRSQKFLKKQRDDKKKKKQDEKQQKKEERKKNSPGGNLEDMIAYVDENGNITDTPPSEKKSENEATENTK